MRYILIASLLVLSVFPAFAADTLAKAQMGKTLNCGYVSYDPAMTKDINTGQWGGYDVDFIKKVSERLHFQTQYAAETNWGQLYADLNTNKFDIFCSTSWVNAEKAKFAFFTKPLYYQPVFLIARADDTRFDGHPERVNDPSIKIAVLEGDAPVGIAKTDFPKAQMHTLSQLQKYSDTYMDVSTKKADVLIGEASGLGLFNKTNPGKLKIVNPKAPLRIYPTSFVLSGNDIQLLHAFNAAIDELTLDGSLEKIMRPYIEFPHAYYPIGRDGRYIVVDKVAKKK